MRKQQCDTSCHNVVVSSQNRSDTMVSVCCNEPKPNYDDLSIEEKKMFCRLVYLLRKRGYSVSDAQLVAYRRILDESIPYDMG